eukprot:12183319-Heterocapsa_arctica.AAC.1
MFVGAADDLGGAGCQVWIHRSLGFRASQFIVVSPRLMYVTGRCKHDDCDLQFVCAHAPTEIAPPEVKDVFWNDISRATADLKRHDPRSLLFYLIDANARTCMQDGGQIGPEDSEALNDN